MELGALFKNEDWSATRVSSDELASIIAHLLRKQITGRTAKSLLLRKSEGETRAVDQIILDEDLFSRLLSQDEYHALAKQLLGEKPDIVRDILKKRQLKKLKWFVGQMIRRSGEGTIEPEMAEAVLMAELKLSSSEVE